MPNLNEYLGGLVASITEGRAMADLKSVKVAEEYAKHPLLQHFSIPRMRIGDIELTIPVALDTYAAPELVKTYEPLAKNFAEVAYAEYCKALGFSDFSKDQALALNTEIVAKIKILNADIQESRSLLPLKSFAQSLTIYTLKQSTSTSLAKYLKLKAVNMELVEARYVSALSSYIKPTIITLPGKPDAMSVIVEAAKLREQKPENIIQIKMTLKEDGMEWNKSENSKGETEIRLLPE